MKKISYKGYRSPPEIIQQAIWLETRPSENCPVFTRIRLVPSWRPIERSIQAVSTIVLMTNKLVHVIGDGPGSDDQR